ncbi:putative bifunctional diguanylate cyclase/phosphodiesterase [Marinobacter sediminum]|uniref:putative bifunctional diguanylate cyclase/phosphodiesterase n=1 Tax=Marinobacter sediminum TaxID=256323 RepID=UPI0019396994|nr:GGDEF domain-containing response regulator [Marinobacter sediminum]
MDNVKRTIRVSVVEDDPADFLILDEMLLDSSRFRFQVSHISTIDEARPQLLAPECDVFLVDYFLGRETARDLLLEARKLHCTVPIIVLTGANSQKLDDEVLELGAADFLPKEELSLPLLERTIGHAMRHKRAELELERMVKRDPLTGLGNRLLFEEILESSLSRCKRSGSSLAVLFMDLDRFKEINDSLGHPTGDLLLVLISDRLRSVIREADFIARIGGDEFTILIDDLHSASDALAVAQKIVSAVSHPSPVGGHELNVSASIGLALYPENGDTPIKLMQKADLALYEAKRRGLSKVQCFTTNLQTQLEKHLSIEKGLRHALEHDQFELYLQPQWELKDRKVLGFEALLRWRCGTSGAVTPDEFIPVAEKTGLIVPIGEWVIFKACQYLKEWQAMGIENCRIAINVSPLQLRAGRFVDALESIASAEGIGTDLIEVEITEESLLDGVEEHGRVPKELSRLRELGIKIAIDDFGTGYSSLRYLRQFPVDVVKIDKSFVSSDQDALMEPEICRAIVTMAESLGMDVVAEGIETQVQLATLQKMGCPLGQGYLVARPLPFEAATRWALVGRASPA